MGSGMGPLVMVLQTWVSMGASNTHGGLGKPRMGPRHSQLAGQHLRELLSQGMLAVAVCQDTGGSQIE